MTGVLAKTGVPALLFSFAVLLSGCGNNQSAPVAAAGGAPADPDIARAAELAEEGLSPELAEGRSIYAMHCGICHGPGETGTIMLGRRLGRESGLLADRDNLPAAYVSQVARVGIGSMPPITQVDLSDEDLTKVARYLARKTGGVQ